MGNRLSLVTLPSRPEFYQVEKAIRTLFAVVVATDSLSKHGYTVESEPRPSKRELGAVRDYLRQLKEVLQDGLSEYGMWEAPSKQPKDKACTFHSGEALISLATELNDAIQCIVMIR
jgi:hypothetical protein